MELYHPADPTMPPTPTSGDACLDRYPRDLKLALTLAERGQVSAGHAVLVRGLQFAQELAHAAMQRVYSESLAVYEKRYGVAVN